MARGPDVFGEGSGGGGRRQLSCANCFVPLTPALAFSIDPEGFVVPFEQAEEAYAALPPLDPPIDPRDPRDEIAASLREAMPICRKCAREHVSST
jgi:hypothetical protein